MGVLLGKSEPVSFRNIKAIVGNPPSWIGGVSFCQVARKGTKFLSSKGHGSSSAVNFSYEVIVSIIVNCHRSRRGGHVGIFTNRSPEITALSPCYGVDVAGSKVHKRFREFEA